VCTDDLCDPVTGCRHRANRAPCDDGDPTTAPDMCLAGECVGGPRDCPLAPADTCMVPADREGSTLFMRDGVSGAGLTWSWTSGAPLFKEAFGDPADGHTGYTLCVYDGVGSTPRLIMGHKIEAGGTCNGSPCWHETADGFVYRSRAFGNSSGIELIQLRAGDTGGGMIKVKGRGGRLQVPQLPLEQDDRVTVQLNDGFACWQANFLSPATANQPGRFLDTSAGE